MRFLSNPSRSSKPSSKSPSSCRDHLPSYRSDSIKTPGFKCIFAIFFENLLLHVCDSFTSVSFAPHPRQFQHARLVIASSSLLHLFLFRSAPVFSNPLAQSNIFHSICYLLISCVTVGTTRGYRIYSLHPFRKLGDSDAGGVRSADMLFTTNLLAVVGAGEQPRMSTRCLRLLHLQTRAPIHELNFASTVRSTVCSDFTQSSVPTFEHRCSNLHSHCFCPRCHLNMRMFSSNSLPNLHHTRCWPFK